MEICRTGVRLPSGPFEEITPQENQKYFSRKENKKMNKTELVTAVAEKTGVTKKDVEAVVKAFTDTVVETVAKGDSIALVGFGTFTSATRAARTGVNPATGKKIKIAASKSPKFKAGKAFKDAVNA